MNDLRDLLRQRVQVRFYTGGVYVEGEVIGIISEPAIIVQDDCGKQTAVSSALPRTILSKEVPHD